LWIFTSSANKAIAEHTGLAQAIRASGALLLENTCPEVVPYNTSWVRHVLTNSMKAEHYLKSGLNGIPTSVMKLSQCIAAAAGEFPFVAGQPGAHDAGPAHVQEAAKGVATQPALRPVEGDYKSRGQGLPSQGDFTVTAEAFVSRAPITFLGFVNRRTGVVEEPGHPADGQSMAGRIAIYPKGVGSTVAPYVLLELHYRGMAPAAIVNTEMDQQSAPAFSLEGIPYAYGFDADPLLGVESGDLVELSRRGEVVTLRVLRRRGR
jgi:predicted aconitase with swiveling domain